jgi:lysozyme family protein
MGFLSRIFRRQSGDNERAASREDYATLIPKLKINSDKIAEVNRLCEQFYKTQERYAVVSKATGVPVDVLFALHYREASLDFRSCLHNGERIIGNGRVTTLVPKGRGPFNSWEAAAIDAITIEKYAFPNEWSLQKKLEFCESFNGMGYKRRGVPSPYVLSYTNGYSCGKYVADGKFDVNFKDQQCGVAAIFLGLNK